MESPGPDRIRKWAELASIGPILGITVAVAWYVGSSLDARFGTTPWLMICFVIFGIVGSFWRFIRTLQQFGELETRHGRRRGPEPPGKETKETDEGSGSR